jgi:CheY-like chemotaxis protein
MKILIVDDDGGTLNALRAYLVSAGHHVVTAKDGPQALSVLQAYTRREKSVDVMVTDLRMPGMTGLELIRKSRLERPRLPAVLTTAYGDESIQWEARSLSACGYLEKPFRPEDLLTKIEDTARWRGEA